MRHGKKFNHLSRTASNRKALLKNLGKSLISNKKIVTTLAKAKALRRYIEPIITKSKLNTTHSRRVVFSFFQDKETVKLLFNEIAQKVGDRPGGYTRIIKLSNTRPGDNAELAMIELVDYNEFIKVKSKRQTKTRRGRSRSKNNAEKTINSNQTLTTSNVSQEVKPSSLNSSDTSNKLKSNDSESEVGDDKSAKNEKNVKSTKVVTNDVKLDQNKLSTPVEKSTNRSNSEKQDETNAKSDNPEKK